MNSLRAPALRACALAAGLTFLGGASAQAAERVTASKAVARSCHDRYLGAAKGTDVSRTTAPSTGLVRARLTGRGDWDVAVFDASTRRNVAGSAAFGARELAEGFVRKGQKLLVQACRYRDGAAGAKLSVSYLGIEGGAGEGGERGQGPGRRRRDARPGGEEPPAGARAGPHRARRRRLRRGRPARRRRRGEAARRRLRVGGPDRRPRRAHEGQPRRRPPRSRPRWSRPRCRPGARPTAAWRTTSSR